MSMSELDQGKKLRGCSPRAWKTELPLKQTVATLGLHSCLQIGLVTMQSDDGENARFGWIALVAARAGALVPFESLEMAYTAGQCQ